MAKRSSSPRSGIETFIEEQVSATSKLLRPILPMGVPRVTKVLSMKSSQDKLREAVEISFNSGYEAFTSLLRIGERLSELEPDRVKEFVEDGIAKSIQANIDFAVDVARLSQRYSIKMLGMVEESLKAARADEEPEEAQMKAETAAPAPARPAREK